VLGARESGEQATPLGGEGLVRRASLRIARELGLQTIEEEHFVRLVMLGHDRTARFELEQRLRMTATVSETLIRPGEPLASMSAAVFTASPQMSKVNLFLPTTPDITGPECSPTRTSSAGNRIFSRRVFIRETTANISSAARQVSIACRRLAVGTPATAI